MIYFVSFIGHLYTRPYTIDTGFREFSHILYVSLICVDMSRTTFSQVYSSFWIARIVQLLMFLTGRGRQETTYLVRWTFWSEIHFIRVLSKRTKTVFTSSHLTILTIVSRRYTLRFRWSRLICDKIVYGHFVLMWASLMQVKRIHAHTHEHAGVQHAMIVASARICGGWQQWGR